MTQASAAMGADSDQYWYKDAIIYELHVKSFAIATPTASEISRV